MSDTPTPSEETKRASKTPRALIATICVLLLVVIALLLTFVVAPALQGNNEGTTTDFFDPNAQSGNLPGKTQEEIQAELDRVVEEGMFNISIASVIVMDEGDDEALVRIENIEANHHNMTVSISLDDSGEVIYESAGLAPGQYLEYVSFNRKLPAGEYSATALFTAYDTGDLSKVGQAAAKITIVVGS